MRDGRRGSRDSTGALGGSARGLRCLYVRQKVGALIRFAHEAAGEGEQGNDEHDHSDDDDEAATKLPQKPQGNGHDQHDRADHDKLADQLVCNHVESPCSRNEISNKSLYHFFTLLSILFG